MVYFHWIVSLVVTAIMSAIYAEKGRNQLSFVFAIFACVCLCILFISIIEYGIKPISCPDFLGMFKKLMSWLKPKKIPSLDKVKKMVLKYRS